jgi:hypothetical protein
VGFRCGERITDEEVDGGFGFSDTELRSCSWETSVIASSDFNCLTVDSSGLVVEVLGGTEVVFVVGGLSPACPCNTGGGNAWGAIYCVNGGGEVVKLGEKTLGIGANGGGERIRGGGEKSRWGFPDGWEGCARTGDGESGLDAEDDILVSRK